VLKKGVACFPYIILPQAGHLRERGEKVILNIEFEGEGVVGYNGDYEINAEKKDLDVFEISRYILNWIRKLHQITTEGGSNKWNRAIFTLLPTGKFDMEFIWDEELDKEIERLSKE